MLTRQTHGLFTLTAPASDSIGYLAIGTGWSMRTADMLIAWPSGSGWLISVRRASGHATPTTLPASQQAAYTLLPQLSSASSVSFLRPLDLGSSARYTPLQRASGQLIVYAASGRRPSGSDVGASIEQHEDGSYGTSALDLSLAVTSSVPVSSPDAAIPTAAWTSYDTVVVIHAVLGSLAWLIFAPAAVLVGRLARRWHAWLTTVR